METVGDRIRSAGLRLDRDMIKLFRPTAQLLNEEIHNLKKLGGG